MGAITFSTQVSGPLFRKKGQPLKDASADLIQDLLKEGEAKVEAQLTTGHGVLTGEYKSTITSKFVRSSAQATGWGSIFGGKEFPNNVKGKFIEAGRGRFKGYHIFRKGTQHLRKVANQRAGKRYARAVQELNS